MLRNLTILLLAASPAIACPYGIALPSGTTDLPAEIKTVRTFPSWQTLQPAQDTLNLDPVITLLSNAKSNNTTIIGSLHQLAQWATDDQHPNDFPLEDKSTWKSYTSSILQNAHPTISHWDILDSYNLLPRQTATPFHYVELLTIAHQNAQTLTPPPKIGFVLANYDLEFLDSALRDGAAGNFDYISLSPYPAHKESAPQFLTVLPALTALLKKHKVPEIPIHITLTGELDDLTLIAPLASASGFDRIFLQTDPKNLKTISSTVTALKIFPSFSESPSVSIKLGEKNTPDGIYQITPSTTPWDPETKANRLHVTANPPQTITDFLIHPSFLTPETRELEITVTAKRIDSENGLGNPTGIYLNYEATHGPRNASFWAVPGENKWQTHTWKITDANFTSALGWNLRLDASGTGNDILIKEITIKR